MQFDLSSTSNVNKTLRASNLTLSEETVTGCFNVSEKKLENAALHLCQESSECTLKATRSLDNFCCKDHGCCNMFQFLFLIGSGNGFFYDLFYTVTESRPINTVTFYNLLIMSFLVVWLIRKVVSFFKVLTARIKHERKDTYANL
jgi:hypothetical protein